MTKASTSTELHISKAELARQLGVSRTYMTLLSQGKRKPSQQLANKMRELTLTVEVPDEFMGMVELG